MERKSLQKSFEKMGARVTIRKGTGVSAGAVRMNVATDSKGEHFTLTIHPEIDESQINIQVLDYDADLRQMLLFVRTPRMQVIWNRGRQNFKVVENETFDERLLVGRDEMHWFVAGVTRAKTVREAFSNLRPQAVTVAMSRSGVKSKDWRKRKTKGFVRQGEWFFVPVHFQEDKDTIIHKNEPIRRSTGGKPHFVEEVVRFGGTIVWVKGDLILNENQFKKLDAAERTYYRQQVSGARVLGRGKVKHPDHHTIVLNGWHEIHLSTESGVMTNAFID